MMTENNSLSRRSFVKNMGIVTSLSLTNPGIISGGTRQSPENKSPNKFKKGLTGPCVSVRTPFTKDGDIDYDAMRKQIDFSIDGGANAIILTFGDSLYSLFSDDEIALVTKKCVEFVKGRVMVVAATGEWHTRKSEEFAVYSAETGADMLMVLPPDWAGSCTKETLVNHYTVAGKHIPVMVVDNYLGRRPASFALAVLKELYDNVPSVVALKDDVTGTLVREICLMTHERWALIAGGQKQNHINMLPYGVDGYFSLMTTFHPEIARKYWDAIQANNMDDAIKIVRDYDMPVFKFLLGLEGSFDAGMHGMLEITGLGKRYRRLPYHSLTDKQMEELRDFLKSKPYVQNFS
jgi:4-hydroxy-tetrahydrodipicolinate synthase